MMRRNDVVSYKNSEGFCFYGRIVRIVEDKALWICCGLHIHLTPLVDLEKHDYSGKMEWTPDRDENGKHIVVYSTYKWYDENVEETKVKFVRPARMQYMPSLRKLKQRASRHHGPNVWNTPLDYEYMEY